MLNHPEERLTSKGKGKLGFQQDSISQSIRKIALALEAGEKNLAWRKVVKLLKKALPPSKGKAQKKWGWRGELKI